MGILVVLIAFISFVICSSSIINGKDFNVTSTSSSPTTPQLSKLSQYNINHLSVSGLSSGAYFAVQFHISYSAIVDGAAIFAGKNINILILNHLLMIYALLTLICIKGGPFYCAQGNLADAENICMTGMLGGPNVVELVALTRSDALLGYVDDPDINLAADRVYLFSGKDDTVVNPVVVKSLQSYYSNFMTATHITADYNVLAEHCIPTVSYGEDCSTLASPYIGNCNFDGAKAGLQAIYGTTLKQGSMIDSNLMSFDQTPYFTDIHSSIGDMGYIYVPTNCQSGKNSCKLHISFHGCLQNLNVIGNVYAANAGFNSWAEANDIIVLYPYVKESTYSPYNPNGCWDWWSYTNAYYGVKKGVQISFIRNLIKAISGK